MKLLLLIPNLKGYQTTLGDNHALTARASGLPRRRRVRVGAVHRYELNFTVKNGDFDYLMAFWRLTQDQAFACQLISDTSQIRWECVRWASVPRISNKGGGVFGVSVQAVQDVASSAPSPSPVSRWWQSKIYPNFEKVDSYFTSSTYAYIFDDELTINQMSVNRGTLTGMAHSFNDEFILNPINVKSGELKSVLNHHEFNDNLILNQITVKSVELVSLLKHHSFNDEFILNPISVKIGELNDIKITHDFSDELLLQTINVKGGNYE